MEHEAWGVKQRTRKAAHVDALAEERVARLAQVDAYLVRPPRLEAAPDERRPVQPLDALDVRDGLARRRAGRPARAAPQAVAPVFHQAGPRRPRRHVAVGDREVVPLHRVAPELGREALLGEPGTGEDDQPAGLLVEPVDHAELRAARTPAGARTSLEPAANARVERVLLPLRIALVGDGAQPGGLRDDDHLRVDVENLQRLEAALDPRRPLVHGQQRPRLDAGRCLRPSLVADAHLPRRDPRPRAAPGHPKRPRTARSSGPARAGGLACWRSLRLAALSVARRAPKPCPGQSRPRISPA